eukprot:422469_1
MRDSIKSFDAFSIFPLKSFVTKLTLDVQSSSYRADSLLLFVYNYVALFPTSSSQNTISYRWRIHASLPRLIHRLSKFCMRLINPIHCDCLDFSPTGCADNWQSSFEVFTDK